MRRIATDRHRYPDELPVPPHGDRLDHAPFSQPVIPQRNPQQCWPPQTISINKRKSGAQEAKVVVDWFIGEVGYDGVGEGGENVETEYESC